jgi:hypothetical protein
MCTTTSTIGVPSLRSVPGASPGTCRRSWRSALARLNGALLLTALVLAHGSADEEQADRAVTLSAATAFVTGNLRIQGERDAAVIHLWNRPVDTIAWLAPIGMAGNYRVRIHYSLARQLAGGKIQVRAAGHELVVPVETTGGWQDFSTCQLGVLQIAAQGEVQVVLQGIELPPMERAAFPDVAWLSLTPTSQAATSSPISAPGQFTGRAIFDGKTFEGWEGDLRWFRIEEGAHVAGSLSGPVPQTEFLCSTSSYRDFELRLSVKIMNGRGNGGVQFRSQRIPGSTEMSGYQADAAGSCWGGLYDESRRQRFLGTRLNEAATFAGLEPAEWNAYRIRCEGPRIRIWLNGILTLDHLELDPSVPQEGYLGLQIHGGGPAEAWYRDIEIQELP